MKAIALKPFMHKGVDYAKDAAVDLDDAQLTALEAAGLVETEEEAPEPPPVTPPVNSAPGPSKDGKKTGKPPEGA